MDSPKDALLLYLSDQDRAGRVLQADRARLWPPLQTFTLPPRCSGLCRQSRSGVGTWGLLTHPGSRALSSRREEWQRAGPRGSDLSRLGPKPTQRWGRWGIFDGKAQGPSSGPWGPPGSP